MENFLKNKGDTMKKVPILYLCIMIIFFTTACVTGGSPKIRIEGAKLIPLLSNNSASAFMLIINDGKGKDTLIGCSIKEFPSSQCELHDIINGRMQKVEKIDIPTKEIVALKRGGLHLMFFNLPDKLGEEVNLILTFEKVGNIEGKLPVEHSEHIHH